MVAQLFFGAWLLPLGYLLYKSGMVPRAIGILIVLDFLAVMIWFLQYFFLPDNRLLSYPGQRHDLLLRSQASADAGPA